VQIVYKSTKRVKISIVYLADFVKMLSNLLLEAFLSNSRGVNSTKSFATLSWQ